jgi:putative oxygen-independent coproporphyrinogen III oxidase
MAEDPPEFGIYLHWPFCQSKCPYCDFNSHVSEAVDQAQWAAAFEAEINRLADEIGGRLISSVYFGGGTPSLMHAETVDRIMTALRSRWSFRNDIEVTLEANPSSVELRRFSGYRDAGVNRISMGFQAMNDADLRALGRLHTADTALLALEAARGVFERVSFDLIYARQNQTLHDWESELTSALSLNPTHLSLYQLTIEDGTAFAKRFAAGALKGLPEEGLSVDLFLATQALCSAKGLAAYEVSNHALPGYESHHNMLYWRGGDYLGIGPGAHGRLRQNGHRIATVAPRSPGKWLNMVLSGKAGEDDRETLTGVEWAEEIILMGLRMTEGINLDDLSQQTGMRIPDSKIYELQDLGLLSSDKQQISATEPGRLILNALIRDLAAALC